MSAFSSALVALLIKYSWIRSASPTSVATELGLLCLSRTGCQEPRRVMRGRKSAPDVERKGRVCRQHVSVQHIQQSRWSTLLQHVLFEAQHAPHGTGCLGNGRWGMGGLSGAVQLYGVARPVAVGLQAGAVSSVAAAVQQGCAP